VTIDGHESVRPERVQHFLDADEVVGFRIPRKKRKGRFNVVRVAKQRRKLESQHDFSVETPYMHQSPRRVAERWLQPSL
jgi:hypothetical protein